MSTLERRVQDLERAAPDALPFKMIVSKIVAVGRLDAEGVRCTGYDREWHRANDESEDQFLDRVYEQVKGIAAAPSIPLVILYPS